jgi:Peptidase family S41
MKRAGRNRLAFCLAATTLWLASCTTIPQRTEAEWQALAKTDLDAVYRTIKDVHPGSIDELNPSFNEWVESGYRDAKELIPHVRSYDQMLDAIRSYVTGFRDGHLFYSDDIRNDDTVMHRMGFRLQHRNDSFVVAAVAPQWMTPLPPLGAKLVSCDGHTAKTLFERFAQFSSDRRTENWQTRVPALIQRKPFAQYELKRCEFELATGGLRELPVTYEPMKTGAYFEHFVTPLATSRPRATNTFELENGILWVRAGNFQPHGEELRELDSMIEKLKGLQGSPEVRTIVFDARRNGGGSSGVGYRIFEAATGGLDYDKTDTSHLKRVYALWRVSEAALKQFNRVREQKRQELGVDHPATQFTERMLANMNAAIVKGERWAEQNDGWLFDRAEVAKRGGKLKGFSGHVALLTDANCASACLDFADLVMLVPGAIHVGQKTSSDTLYIDTGSMRMPSGNRLVVPLKVWRNRLRGNNEALVPSVPIELSAQSESSVRKQVLRAIPSVYRVVR